MNSNWALMAKIDSIDREEGVYDLLFEDSIKCANCDSKIVDVIKVQENKEKQLQIIAECPFCGDSSFLYEIKGVVYLQATDGITIVDMPTEVDNNRTKMIIRCVKNE